MSTFIFTSVYLASIYSNWRKTPKQKTAPTNLGLQLLHQLRLPLLALLVSGQFAFVGRLLLVQPPPQVHVLLRQAARLGRVTVTVPRLKTQGLLQLWVWVDAGLVWGVRCRLTPAPLADGSVMLGIWIKKKLGFRRNPIRQRVLHFRT